MPDQQPLLSADDWNLIQAVDGRFPDKHIADNFKSYIDLSPADRVSKAYADRQHVLRAGWKRRGMPEADTETLDAHVISMKTLAVDYLSHYPNLNVILAIIESHDTGEVIVGDFIPNGFIPGDGLNKVEKDRIEWLAINVIYHAAPDMIERYLDYTTRRNIEARIVKDLDKAQMFLRSKQYSFTHPDIDLSEFNLDSQNYEWLTQEGLTIFYQAMRKLS